MVGSLLYTTGQGVGGIQLESSWTFINLIQGSLPWNLKNPTEREAVQKAQRGKQMKGFGFALRYRQTG
jgi:hypothetical protein